MKLKNINEFIIESKDSETVTISMLERVGSIHKLKVDDKVYYQATTRFIPGIVSDEDGEGNDAVRMISFESPVPGSSKQHNTNFIEIDVHSKKFFDFLYKRR